ncbi:hypothetical protein P7K49_020461, partial [Saguinus oedipus]
NLPITTPNFHPGNYSSSPTAHVAVPPPPRATDRAHNVVLPKQLLSDWFTKGH